MNRSKSFPEHLSGTVGRAEDADTRKQSTASACDISDKSDAKVSSKSDESIARLGANVHEDYLATTRKETLPVSSSKDPDSDDLDLIQVEDG